MKNKTQKTVTYQYRNQNKSLKIMNEIKNLKSKQIIYHTKIYLDQIAEIIKHLIQNITELDRNQMTPSS